MDIDKIKSGYIQRIEETRYSFDQAKRKIYVLGTIRLFVALLAIGLLIAFRGHVNFFVIASVALCIIFFLWLVLEYSKLLKKKDYIKTSITSDENELKAFDYDFSAYDGASDKINSEHPFSLDLDLFENHSIFQSINRTSTSIGKDILAGWFQNPLKDKQLILKRQQAVKELAGNEPLIHHFEVTGLLNPGKLSDLDDLRLFATEPFLFLNNRWWNILSYFIPAFWVVVIALSILGYVPSFLFMLIYLFTFVVSESTFKKVNLLQQKIGKKMSILNVYSSQIEIIENWNAHSQELSEIKQAFVKNNFCASKKIKKLARLSGELEQRTNMLVHLLLNPFALWDIRKSLAIEKWKQEHASSLESWLKSLGEFDAFCSLGKYAFCHPGYIYPELTDHYLEMEGKDLGHPLLHRDVCVKNDIHIASSSFFMIVTGANMAGKSTYLRTIGINYLLACIGAPVCAGFLRLYPAGLYTSLRTSDSLTNNESYFFAELKRLKVIIDELEAGHELFIILDEILKGTNSVDKQKGSLALLKQFVRLKSGGIIATHDLSLGNLEKEFPENVRNFHFDADIINDELIFSYQLKTGIAQNMNACFLMNKMGISI